MQQEPHTSQVAFRPHGDSGFAAGNWLTSCLALYEPQAAVGFSVYDPQGCRSVLSAQAAELSSPHLLSVPVLIGCWVISSGNTGQIRLLGSAGWFHTPEFNAPFLNSSSKHITEFSCGVFGEYKSYSQSSHFHFSAENCDFWLLEFVFAREMVLFVFLLILVIQLWETTRTGEVGLNHCKQPRCVFLGFECAAGNYRMIEGDYAHIPRPKAKAQKQNLQRRWWKWVSLTEPLSLA